MLHDIHEKGMCDQCSMLGYVVLLLSSCLVDSSPNNHNSITDWLVYHDASKSPLYEAGITCSSLGACFNIYTVVTVIDIDEVLMPQIVEIVVCFNIILVFCIWNWKDVSLGCEIEKC